MTTSEEGSRNRDVALGWLSETIRALHTNGQVDASGVLGALSSDIAARLYILQHAGEWFSAGASADGMLEALDWEGWPRIANVMGHACSGETRMKPTRRQKYLSSAQRGLQAFERWLVNQLELADGDVAQSMSGFLEELLDDVA